MGEQTPQNINREGEIKNKEEKKEKEKPSNFLEIGSGPVPFLDRDKLKEGDNYYIVEINENELETLKKFLFFEEKVKGKKYKGNIFTILGDGRNLSFEDKKMDKVFLSNVFGDPRILDKNKEEIIEEVKRVLKDEGVLVVKEDTYPMNVNNLISILKEKGFLLEKKIDTPQEWQKEVSLYHSGPLARFLPSAYMLFLKKEIKYKL